MNNFYFLSQPLLQDLITLLIKQNYQCIGPQVCDSYIQYDFLSDASQLPWGVGDKHAPGFYELTSTDKTQAFAWANSPSSIKPFLFKQQESIWRVQRNGAGKICFEPVIEYQPQALIGVRPCDITAMLVQDRVFLADPVEPRYAARRKSLFIVVVNCNAPSANCFCIAAGYDVAAKEQFDIAMTEIADGFVVESGSDKGAVLVEQLQLTIATAQQIQEANTRLTKARALQTKQLSKLTDDATLSNHPHWQNIADRCVGCGTCTQVCPTCFCHKQSSQETTEGYEQTREWDSCFAENHSFVNGAPLRKDTKSRYQQWLMHKFVYWKDQFDQNGCVGCGRCISWCPAGIDVTEEVKQLSKHNHET